MGSKETIIKIRAGNRAAAQLARQATRAEFKYTMNVEDALYGNLSTNISGNTAKMTAEQARLSGALLRLKENQAAASGRISRGARSDVQSAYGSAVAGGNRLNLQGVQATGKAGRMVTGAQAAAGGIVARGNQAAASTLASGVQMAQAGAQAQVADALSYRARNDATLAASRANQLDMMILQNKLDIENFKKKAAITDQKTNSGAAALTSFAATVVPGLHSFFNDTTLAVAHPGEYVTPAEAVAAWAEENGVAPEDPRYGVALSVAQAMRQGINPNGDFTVSSIQANVAQQLALLYPNLSQAEIANLTDTIGAASTGWTYEQEQATQSSQGYVAGTGPAPGNPYPPGSSQATAWDKEWARTH